MSEDWTWWAGSNDDFYTVGPCATKQDAIDEMIHDGLCEQSKGDEFAHIIQVTEATNGPLKLRDYIRADTVLEDADEQAYGSDRISSEYDDTVFKVTPAQGTDLRERLMKVCDDWQESHGLIFTTSTFENMRSQETVYIPI